MRTGMMACCIGMGVVAWSPLLLPWWWLLFGGCGVVFVGWRLPGARAHRIWPLVFGLSCGVVWGSLYGAFVTRSLLPSALEQQPLWLSGHIVDLIETRQTYGRESQRFFLRVDDCRRVDGITCNVPLHTVQLTAYQPLPIASGEHWWLRVKLKRPHGFANPGGFDFESWQVQRRISAVGSVSGAANAERLAPAAITSSDHWRAVLRDRLQIQLANFQYRGLLLALLVADDSEITREQWRLFRDTGTIHLFVVSGSHIAFTGGLVWWLCNLWRRSPLGDGSRREQLACVLPALAIACLYALIAGMGLPIQRALIMFAVVLLSSVWRRDVRFFDVLLLALILVLLRDPLAARDAGCWFSFAAVAALSLAFSSFTQGHGAGRDRWRWWRAQWLIFVVCLPVLMMIGGQLTLLSLPANLIAVPLTTIVTLPLAFIALVSEPVTPVFAGWCWQGADLSLRLLLWLLKRLSDCGGRFIFPLAVSPQGLLFALAAVLLLILPRGVKARGLAPVMLLPVFFPQAVAIDEKALRLTVFDVGQGLSVLVETRSHRLLYDTGPAFAAGSSAAELAVLPALRQRGIRALDLLMVSHRDSDHAGGVTSVLAELAVKDVLVGERLRSQHPSKLQLQPRTQQHEQQQAPPRFCVEGQRWQWDGVVFTVLNPPALTRAEGNKRSCVLRIDAGASSVLLTGDIETTVEARLLGAKLAPATVLIAPHHGSRSSSSPTFVAAVQPRYVVFSAGY
ncbi:MAG: DNA internalization-related competence protein ComEC/Rec2, partial [Spongiibacteraceae bacterium]